MRCFIHDHASEGGAQLAGTTVPVALPSTVPSNLHPTTLSIWMFSIVSPVHGGPFGPAQKHRARYQN